MDFYIVPIPQGVLDISYDIIIESIAISETEAIVKFNYNYRS